MFDLTRDASVEAIGRQGVVPVAYLGIIFGGGLDRWRARGARACSGVWGRCPQWGPGAKPLVGGQGGEAPLKLTRFHKMRDKFCIKTCI